MPAPPLPYEVVEKIVKIVACDPSYYLEFPALHYPRTKTLKSCALVSRCWLAPARHYLFADDKPSFFFYVPFMERRFKEFKSLCLSPHSTMHLTRIDSLIAESKSDTLTSTDAFFEWFAGTSAASSITSITFRTSHTFSFYRFPEHTLPGFQAFHSLAVLSLCYQMFTRPSQVILLLTSLPRLGTLSCENVRVEETSDPSEKPTQLPSPVYLETLITDHPSFFSSLHPHITFPNLKKLLYRDTGVYRAAPNDRLQEFAYVGRVLELIGGRLEVLDLDCRTRHLGDKYVYEHRSTISQIFDLSVRAPVLKELVLRMQNEMVLLALTFQNPHTSLESITLNTRLDDIDLSVCDRTLRRSTPLLRVFKVGVPTVEADEFKLDQDRPGSYVWEEIRREEEEMEKARMKMPWCAERDCLRPNITYVYNNRRRQYY
ncbi:hypothetical protein VNI00_003064 [Paramarasmius palmivorus]|uniref:F-box domain-containing protein n=1 Tax=Paramarasmius palmivorus TaxID=297713 RepID=A0AAW0DZD5_9AGAR